MFMNKTVGLVFALTVLSLIAVAAGPVIGVAVSEGPLRLNQSLIQGNANVEAGSVVESMAAEVRVRLSNGVAASLAPQSSARFDGQGVELRSGGGVFANSNGYPVNALGFDIRPEGNSRANLYLADGQLQVGALSGTILVSNRDGILVARVMSGKAVAVTPAAANDSTSTMTGTLRQQSGRWILRDELTNVLSELRGAEFGEHAGKRVHVTGTTTAAAGNSDRVVEVARLTPAAQGGAARPTSPQGASRPGSSAPAKQGGAGMSSGAKVAIIVAVAGGAAGGVVLATMSR